MSESEDTLKQLEDQYRGLRPQYERYCIKLRELLEDLLERKGVRYQVVDERAKTVESFIEKIQRKGKSYNEPLAEVPDLAGIRVILYYEEDVKLACDLIRNELKVDEGRSEDKRAELTPDRFGYLSVHLISEVSGNRISLPEWEPFKGLFCEIQVRSVLQHAWAAISHALQYKREADVPAELKRRLFRVSGLLELADEQFSLLREEQDALSSTIAQRVAKSDLDIAIDAISLAQFIGTSQDAKAMIKAGRDAGFEGEDTPYEFLSDLVEICETVGISEIVGLSRTLVAVQPRALDVLGSIFEASDGYWEASGDFLIALGVIAGHPKSFSRATFVDQEWGKVETEAVLQAIGKKRSSRKKKR